MILEIFLCCIIPLNSNVLYIFILVRHLSKQKYLIIADYYIKEMTVCSITAIYIFEIITLKYHFKLRVKLSSMGSVLNLHSL